MKYDIKEIINKYLKSEISLKIFEDTLLEIIKLNESEILDEILEDIAYTKLGILSSRDKSYGLISHIELKNKLRQYLKIID